MARPGFFQPDLLSVEHVARHVGMLQGQLLAEEGGVVVRRGVSVSCGMGGAIGFPASGRATLAAVRGLALRAIPTALPCGTTRGIIKAFAPRTELSMTETATPDAGAPALAPTSSMNSIPCWTICARAAKRSRSGSFATVSWPRWCAAVGPSARPNTCPCCWATVRRWNWPRVSPCRCSKPLPMPRSRRVSRTVDAPLERGAGATGCRRQVARRGPGVCPRGHGHARCGRQPARRGARRARRTGDSLFCAGVGAGLHVCGGKLARRMGRAARQGGRAVAR